MLPVWVSEPVSKKQNLQCLIRNGIILPWLLLFPCNVAEIFLALVVRLSLVLLGIHLLLVLYLILKTTPHALWALGWKQVPQVILTDILTDKSVDVIHNNNKITITITITTIITIVIVISIVIKIRRIKISTIIKKNQENWDKLF